MSSDVPHADTRVTVIRPIEGWKGLDLRELWEARELFGFLVWRDVRLRYKQTLLGAAWALAQPVLMTAVFTLALGRLSGARPPDMPYAVFAYTGMWAWAFFSTAVTQAGASVVSAERVITKVYFPRLAIPFAAVGAGLVDFAIGSIGFVALMALYGIAPGWSMLLAPIPVALLALLAMGLGALLSALMVAYRDVRFVLPFLVQLLLFATPAIYMAGAPAPQEGFRLLDLHPLQGVVQGFRAMLLSQPVPWRALSVSAAVIAGIFVAGTLTFRRLEDRFADII